MYLCQGLIYDLLLMLLSSLLLFFAAFLGGGAVLLINHIKAQLFNLLLVFVGSYLFALTILHLLPDLFEGDLSGHFIGIYILVGFFLQLFLETFSKGVEHGHVYEEHTYKNHVPISAFSIFFSLCVHAFLDGVIVNNATLGTMTAAACSFNTKLLIGMVLHKASEALALVSVLKRAMLIRWHIMGYLIGFAFASPMGLWVSSYASKHFLLNPKVFIALAAVAVGNLLHIATTIFFESNPHHQLTRSRLGAVIAGIIFVIVLEYSL